MSFFTKIVLTIKAREPVVLTVFMIALAGGTWDLVVFVYFLSEAAP